MAYVRKTRDVWKILCWYPDTGWEEECEELSYKDAQMNAKLYRENTGLPVRIKKCRERIEKEDA